MVDKRTFVVESLPSLKYTYTSVHMCIHTYITTCLYVCVRVCISTHIHIDMCVYTGFNHVDMLASLPSREAKISSICYVPTLPWHISLSARKRLDFELWV